MNPRFQDLPYNAVVRQVTDRLYAKVARHIPEIEWPVHAATIYEILRLKAEMGAVILAHHYQRPEIYLTVADFRGDSLQLAREAARTDAKIIVQAGVHFMAETSKILCPDKTVLIPSMKAGCSLAASITGEDVRALKAKHPGLPVVTYVNTSAEVKAESDVCCTSSNAVAVVEDIARQWGVDTVIFIPDQYLAANVAALTKVKIVSWNGACEVHEKFTPKDIADFRAMFPGVVVLAHPECPPEVVAVADHSGSTSSMITFVEKLDKTKPHKIALITECSMSDNVAANFPEVEFVKPCEICPHMQQITLPKILLSLQKLQYEVLVPDEIAARARVSIERMLEVGKPIPAH